MFGYERKELIERKLKSSFQSIFDALIQRVMPISLRIRVQAGGARII